MTYQDISAVHDGAIARITVERPDRLNSMGNRTADELNDAFARAESDPAIRVAILTGRDRAFGAGYDLSTVDPDKEPDLAYVVEHHFNPLVRRMRASRLPIISQVNGACAGGSVGIALAGDIVVAARSAFFYEPFVGISLVPDCGNTLFLTRAVGRLRAMPAMLLGDRISADEAHQWGLVWKVFDDAELPAATEAMAKRLADRTPETVADTKRLVTLASDFGMDAQLDLERDLQGVAGRRPAMKAAIAAFFAARKK